MIGFDCSGMLEEAADAAACVIVSQAGKTDEFYSIGSCVVWVHQRAHSIAIGFDARSAAVVACLICLVGLFGLLSSLVAATHRSAVATRKD